MGALKKLTQAYCATSGLLLAMLGVAVAVAMVAGVVNADRWEKTLELYLGVADADAEAPAASLEEIARVEGRENPSGMRLWQKRLQSMGEQLETDVSGLGAEQDRLNVLEADLAALGDALASLLSAYSGSVVSAGSLNVDAALWTEQVKEWTAHKERMPRLVETLGTMDAKALATILVGGSEELDERSTVELLAELSPRKAGQVLSEMGKLDPTRASRMIALLGASDSPRVAND